MFTYAAGVARFMKPVDAVAIDTGKNPYISPENGDSPYTKSHGPDDLPS